MTILFAILLLGALVVALGTYFFGHKDEAPIEVGAGDCSTCSGDNAKCEQTCMMEAAVKPIEYFDDEELDRYRGRRSDEYTDDEAEEFLEVVRTMQPGDVRPWTRSLTLRQIELPDQAKDEVFQLIMD